MGRKVVFLAISLALVAPFSSQSVFAQVNQFTAGYNRAEVEKRAFFDGRGGRRLSWSFWVGSKEDKLSCRETRFLINDTNPGGMDHVSVAISGKLCKNEDGFVYSEKWAWNYLVDYDAPGTFGDREKSKAVVAFATMLSEHSSDYRNSIVTTGKIVIKLKPLYERMKFRGDKNILFAALLAFVTNDTTAVQFSPQDGTFISYNSRLASSREPGLKRVSFRPNPNQTASQSVEDIFVTLRLK